MNEVSFIYSLGGLVSNHLLSELRHEKPKGSAKKLAGKDCFRCDNGNYAFDKFEVEIGELFDLVRKDWHDHRELLVDFTKEDKVADLGKVRNQLLIPLLLRLGYYPKYNQEHVIGDLAQEDSRRGNRFKITHWGWDPADPTANPGHTPPPMILTNQNLDARDEKGERSAHEEMQQFLNHSKPNRWGIVANQHQIRILRDFHHTSVKGGIVIEISQMLEADSFPDFRALYRLLHTSRFFTKKVNDDDLDEEKIQGGKLERFYQDSQQEGVALGKALQPQVRGALESLLRGVLAENKELEEKIQDNPEKGREVYREFLTILYRIMFLLFAEQRGLVKRAKETYSQSYSISRLRKLAETREPEPNQHDLWEGLKATFRMFAGIEDGDNLGKMAKVMGANAYNGDLFNLTKTPELNESKCSNRHVLDAISSLTTVELGRVRQYIDFKSLGVDELGSVYENLLSYTLRYQDDQVKMVELKLERSQGGVHYTPPALVDLTLDQVLPDLIKERLEGLTNPTDKEAAILNLRIIDPACGSAAFLIRTVNRLAETLLEIRIDRGIERERERERVSLVSRRRAIPMPARHPATLHLRCRQRPIRSRIGQSLTMDQLRSRQPTTRIPRPQDRLRRQPGRLAPLQPTQIHTRRSLQPA